MAGIDDPEALARDNVDLVRNGYEHFAATGELPPELTSDDFVWDMSRYEGWPEDQTYAGREAANGFLSTWMGAFEDWSYELESVRGAGDRVVVIARQRGRARATGAEVDMRFAQIYTIRDGLQVRMEMYSDIDAAVRDAGLGS